MTDIPCNLWDFANKLIIIQVQYGKKRGIQKEAQICCLIILLTLCISLLLVVWNSDTRRRLSLDRTFSWNVWKGCYPSDKQPKLLNTFLLQGGTNVASNDSEMARRLKYWESLKNVLTNNIFLFVISPTRPSIKKLL